MVRAGSSWTEISDDTFPDSALRAYLSGSSFDLNGDGYLSDEEKAAVTTLNLHSMGIADLSGVETFTNLTSLDCASNDLTGTLDLSSCTQLVYIDCSFNRLTALDVSNCTKLDTLYCQANQLTELDVSNNTLLTQLYCGANLLQVLDVSKNVSLVTLDCVSNQLADLDVSKNTLLEGLGCFSNQLTVLDVSQNPALKWLSCEDNQLLKLDISNNTVLTSLWCDMQEFIITSLDITGRAEFPYSLKLGLDSTDLAYNVLSLDVIDSSDGVIHHSADIASATLYFSAKPETITYIYDTGYYGDGTSMDVTIAVSSDVQAPPFSITLTPSQPVTPSHRLCSQPLWPPET